MPKISIKQYDLYFLAVGLAYDKKQFNNRLRELIHYLARKPSEANRLMEKIKLFFTHISDATILTVLRNKALKGKRSVILYGDVPYTRNFFINLVYIKSKDPEIDHTLRQALKKYINAGYWGYSLLSWILKDVEKKIFELHDSPKMSIHIKGETPEALKTLLDRACIYEPAYSDDADLLISLKKEDNNYVEIPIFTTVSKINEQVLDEIYKDLGSPKRPCFVTLGGAEHNVFLRYLITRDRKTPRRRIFDVHNAWDYLELMNFKKRRVPALGISTHEYVEARIINAKTGLEERFSRAKGGRSGGVIAILRDFSITRNIQGDVWIIMGAGRGGALATKLSAIATIENSFDIPKGSLITIYYKNFSAEIGDIPLIDHELFRNKDILVLYETNRKVLLPLIRNWEIANYIVPE